MKILPGVIALFLCLPAFSAAASPFDRLAGEWGGTVDSGDSCAWKVRASFKPGETDFSGDFTFEGDCADEPRTGQFTIRNTTPSCFAATVKITGMPSMAMTGCADKAGNITFKTSGFSGKITFGKGNNALKLLVTAEQGTAKGQFRRMVKKKRRGGAKGGAKKTAGPKKEQAEAQDVLIGGY